MKLHRLAYCAVLILSGLQSSAQQQNAVRSAAPANTGSISGRVFAITQGGDLKPARLAHVFLLYYADVQGKGASNGEQLLTAGAVWGSAVLDSKLRHLKEDTELAQKGLDVDRLTCLGGLAAVDEALKEALDWTGLTNIRNSSNT